MKSCYYLCVCTNNILKSKRFGCNATSSDAEMNHTAAPVASCMVVQAKTNESHTLRRGFWSGCFDGKTMKALKVVDGEWANSQEIGAAEIDSILRFLISCTNTHARTQESNIEIHYLRVPNAWIVVWLAVCLSIAPPVYLYISNQFHFIELWFAL